MSNTFHYSRHEWTSGPADNRITWAVQTLILANAAIFAGQLILDVPLGTRAGAFAGAAAPGGFVADILSFRCVDVLRGFLWQPLTYMFLHGGLMHLVMNMLWLFFFGPEVERVLGSRQFLRFYLLCGTAGVFANFVPILTTFSASVVGASGAVMGVLVAYAITNPEREFFLFPLPVPINARAMVYIVIALNIVSALSPGDATSVHTHFGGMAMGAAYMKLVPKLRTWRRQRNAPGPAPRNPLDEVGDAVDNIFKFDSKRGRRK